VFPFTWKGETYSECITDDGNLEKASCATKVNSQGVAVAGSLSPCLPGCPGTAWECTVQMLFNLNGKCVPRSEAESLLQASVYPAEIDQYFGNDTVLLEAPVCPQSEDGRDPQKTCQCGPALPRLNGGTEGGCQEDSIKDYTYDGEDDKGWCFLDNVQDPKEPSSDCYSDVEWDVSRGKFWSREACKAREELGEGSVIID